MKTKIRVELEVFVPSEGRRDPHNTADSKESSFVGFSGCKSSVLKGFIYETDFRQ